MKYVSGETFWTKINRVPYKYTYLSEDINCQVLIVGGGITGALCSYYFNEAGIDTVLVDKNILGYESTSASTSILQYEIDTDLIGLSGLYGMEKASRSFKLCEASVKNIKNIAARLKEDCGFSEQQCLYYTKKSNEIDYFRREYELRKQQNFDVEYLSEENSKEKFSFPIKAGIFSKAGAGQLDPYLFTVELIKYCSDKGLRVYENTEILFWENTHKGIRAVTRNGFIINAEKMVAAPGFYGKHFIDKRIIKQSRTFTIVTSPVENFEDWNSRCIIRDSEENYTYLRTTSDNRIIIGGEDIDVGGDNSSVSNIEEDAKVCAQKYASLETNLRYMFPDIRDVKIDYRFNGIFGNTKDGLPYIGEYEKQPGVLFCLGYGSNGILYADFGAQLLRDLYLGRTSEDLDLFSFTR